MPSISFHACARIFQRLELQSLRRNSNGPAVREKQFSIGRNEMRHRVPFPAMSMEPETTIHRVDHSFPTALEFAIARCAVFSDARAHSAMC